MSKANESQIHLHIHEGASPEAVRAAAEVLVLRGEVQEESAEEASGGQPDPEVSDEKRAEYVRRAYEESSGMAKPLLEFLADNPERLIPFPEVSQHLGYETARSLPGLLGSFGRRAKHRYEGRWPFAAREIGDQWHLMMSSENAEIVNSLR